MHEMSIAQSLIELACEKALEENAVHVSQLNIRVGRLAGVVKNALLLSFDVAAEGTACAGAILSVEEVPVTLWCDTCNKAQDPINAFHFACSQCESPSTKIVTGQELDLVSIEIEIADECKPVV
jgi:hydrogenase nickel incorporation protein HypA/HybF